MLRKYGVDRVGATRSCSTLTWVEFDRWLGYGKQIISGETEHYYVLDGFYENFSPFLYHNSPLKGASTNCLSKGLGTEF